MGVVGLQGAIGLEWTIGLAGAPGKVIFVWHMVTIQQGYSFFKVNVDVCESDSLKKLME